MAFTSLHLHLEPPLRSDFKCKVPAAHQQPTSLSSVGHTAMVSFCAMAAQGCILPNTRAGAWEATNISIYSGGCGFSAHFTFALNLEVLEVSLNNYFLNSYFFLLSVMYKKLVKVLKIIEERKYFYIKKLVICLS